MSSFPYKAVLLIGATSGIGAAMADKLVGSGVFVIAVGRRQDRLDAFVARHDPAHAAAVCYDIADTAGQEGFVKSVLANHPTIDCLFLNAGTQHPVPLARPADVDLPAFHNEVAINFSRQVDLCVRFLPHLEAARGGLIVTGTHIVVAPAAPLAAYSASKAALSSFVACVRALQRGRVRVHEIWAPAVQTELHDFMGEERGRKIGMPVQDFTEQVYAQLAEGKEMVVVGSAVGTSHEEMRALIEKRAAVSDALNEYLLANAPGNAPASAPR